MCPSFKGLMNRSRTYLIHIIGKRRNPKDLAITLSDRGIVTVRFDFRVPCQVDEYRPVCRIVANGYREARQVVAVRGRDAATPAPDHRQTDGTGRCGISTAFSLEDGFGVRSRESDGGLA